MKVFMFNHSGSLNRGCEAIIRGTVNILNGCRDGNSYTLSSFSPGEDKVLADITGTIPFSPRRLKKADYVKAALKIRLFGDERYSIIKGCEDFLSRAEEADICLSVGGDTYCYGDNPVIRVLTEELINRGKKTVLWGASIGEEDLTPAKEENLKKLTAVFARESLSRDLIRSRNLNKNVFLFPDPAFAMPAEFLPLPAGWDEGNTIGINLSKLTVKKKPELTAIFSDFILYLIEQTPFSVALIPHVTSPANNDADVLNKLFESRKERAGNRLLILPDTLTAPQYKGYIARLRFLTAARTHASIAAYSSGVPTLVLGYSVKSKGIARDIFGEESSVIQAENIRRLEDLATPFNSMLKTEAQIREVSAQKNPQLTAAAFEAGKKITEILNSG